MSVSGLLPFTSTLLTAFFLGLGADGLRIQRYPAGDASGQAEQLRIVLTSTRSSWTTSA